MICTSSVRPEREDSAYATNVTASSLYSSGYNCGASSWYLMRSVGMYSYLPCSGMFANPFGAYMLGMNYGYLWNGPNYYIPPMGMIGMPVQGGGGGGGGVFAGNLPKVPAIRGSVCVPLIHRIAIDAAWDQMVWPIVPEHATAGSISQVNESLGVVVAQLGHYLLGSWQYRKGIVGEKSRLHSLSRDHGGS